MIKEQINSIENIPEKYKNNKDVKIMLYLVSCRGGDTELHEDKEIYEAQQKVYNNGLYKITDRKARSTDIIFEKPGYDDEAKGTKKRKLDRKQDVETVKKQKKGGGRKTKKAKKNKKKKTKSVKKRAKNKTRKIKIKKRKSVKKRAKKY